MPTTSAVVTHFDNKKPVYVIKSFFYGKTNNSVRHATDQPLRLEQVPKQYQTSEFIKQGRVLNTIPAMVEPKVNNGIQILPEESKEVVNTNPIAPEADGVRASTPTAKRRAMKKTAASAKAVNAKSESTKK